MVLLLRERAVAADFILSVAQQFLLFFFEVEAILLTPFVRMLKEKEKEMALVGSSLCCQLKSSWTELFAGEILLPFNFIRSPLRHCWSGESWRQWIILIHRAQVSTFSILISFIVVHLKQLDCPPIISFISRHSMVWFENKWHEGPGAIVLIESLLPYVQHPIPAPQGQIELDVRHTSRTSTQYTTLN